MSVLKTLTENIVKRDLQHEGAALQQKWEKTGLLEGLDGDYQKNTMSVLLENQAKELLREASTMVSGQVDGYAAVAFPIVRRVFGGLLANDLVSVQPMSLPSGLIFFMDFTKGSNRDGQEDTSVYGGGTTGSGVMTGVNVDDNSEGFYNLRQGYTAARGGVNVTNVGNAGTISAAAGIDLNAPGSMSIGSKQALRFDADLCSRAHGANFIAQVITIEVDQAEAHGVSTDPRASFGSTDEALPAAGVATSPMNRIMLNALSHLDLTEVGGGAITTHANFSQATEARVVRRLTRFLDASGNAFVAADPSTILTTAGAKLELVIVHNDASPLGAADLGAPVELNFAISDNLQSVSTALGALEGDATWQFEDNQFTTDAGIPEIDIRVDSAAVTAATRKLKARWTPELAQDLNAYHNLDAEVELTGVLSEHIALEIDQEILGDLIRGATASTLHWSRNPGLFVNQNDGSDASPMGDFTGTVSEWYETLVETVNDVSASIHRKTLRGGANFLVCGPEVANILEFTSGFRASVTHDDDKGTVGALNAGSISKKWDLWVDPYFPRNLILVGRKGGSFLESGYVYAPYVPLQVTPTIFDPDDFTPRKAVMTRYGKKMVQSDMYGLVVIRDLKSS